MVTICTTCCNISTYRLCVLYHFSWIKGWQAAFRVSTWLIRRCWHRQRFVLRNG